ncbi:hypothetical protein RCH18_002105 [Flavobacterium sp. PL11]|jgi:hypothetical protein|uniref:hypothetical protein n=1 Tax=Flavobacterium sp. PL11 TaxID=3071717 RepID=UPI002DFEBCB6|nr:hypothetical protein [Flavobacterium sp. PL11]
MKFCAKNLVAFIVLSMGMLLYCDLFYEPSTDSSPLELCFENNAVTDYTSTDYDCNEKEKSIFSIPFTFTVKRNANHIYFHITFRANQPFLSVWQPPKLS